MSFREKLNAVDNQPEVRAPAPSAGEGYYAVKARIHLKLLDKFDLAALEALPPAMLRAEIAAMAERLLDEEPAALNELERRALIRDIGHEM
ncbi:MAG TPA: CpaF family protein, partial [Telluria sp.]